LLDAEILADVYLAMTGGQTRLQLGTDEQLVSAATVRTRTFDSKRPPLKVIRASDEELNAHLQRLEAIAKESGDNCVWLRAEQATDS
jgi:DNA polymerase-3 subunit epsilon